MTKQEIRDELHRIVSGLVGDLNNVMNMIAALPDGNPEPEPKPDIQREINLLGKPWPGMGEVIIVAPVNPTRPYFAATRIGHDGPDTNIAITVLKNGQPLNGIPIKVKVERTDVEWIIYSGSKSDGLAEFTYDDKAFSVEICEDGATSDVVHEVSTNRKMPDDKPLDMTRGHLRTGITFKLFS